MIKVSTHTGVLKGRKGEAGQADLQTKPAHLLLLKPGMIVIVGSPL